MSTARRWPARKAAPRRKRSRPSNGESECNSHAVRVHRDEWPFAHSRRNHVELFLHMVAQLSSYRLLLMSDKLQFVVRFCTASATTDKLKFVGLVDSLRYIFRLGLHALRSGEDVMKEHCQKSQQREDQRNRLRDPLPISEAEWYLRIGRQASVEFRMLRVVQNVNYVRAADRLRIVHACIRESRHIAKLRRASFSQLFHLVFGAEVQTSGGTGFYTGGLEPGPNSIGAQRTLEDFLGRRVEFRNVERAARNTVLTADTVLLIEVDDAVGVLNNRAVSGTRAQAARIGAVHALVLAHEPHQGSVFTFVLVELDQVPVVPFGRGHRMVSIIEGRLAERIGIPFDAGDLASLAADARRRIHELADL